MYKCVPYVLFCIDSRSNMDKKGREKCITDLLFGQHSLKLLSFCITHIYRQTKVERENGIDEREEKIVC